MPIVPAAQSMPTGTGDCACMLAATQGACTPLNGGPLFVPRVHLFLRWEPYPVIRRFDHQ